MAILKVTLCRDKTSTYDAGQTSGTATRTYIVLSDSLMDNDTMIKNAGGVPEYGSRIIGLPAHCVLLRKSLKRLPSIVYNNTTGYRWEVTCEFGPYVTPKGGVPNTGMVVAYEEAPWNRVYPITERSAGFDPIYIGCDLDNKPFQTSAGEPFSTCPPVNVPRYSIQWRRLVVGTWAANAASIRGFFGCINADGFLGFAAKHVKIVDYSISEQTWQSPTSGTSSVYCDVQWSAVAIPYLAFRANGYQDRVLDKGTRYKDEDDHLCYPQDDEGQKSFSEVFLDGTGKKLENVDATNAVWLDFRTCLECSFATIAPL